MAQSRHSLFQQFAASDWDGFLKGGVEKEGLRVDANGFIAQTPHPEALGSALTHPPRITTDYSEALLELITPVFDNTEAMLASLRDIHRFVQQNLDNEVFWAASMPCEIDGDASIPIAEYGSSNTGRLKHVYRQGLAVRYGRIMQSIAGAHYNLSLPDSFWRKWQELVGNKDSLRDFKSDQYFWLIRNFRRRSWLLMLLFGASPALDASFVAGVRHDLARFDDRTWFGQHATSLRMGGDLGYHNNAQASLNICFNELSTYTRTLDRAIHTNWPAYEAIGTRRNGEFVQINTNVLQIENEYYSAVRPKRTTERGGEKPIQALDARGGVEYIEVRCLDLDPFSPVGVNREQIDFLDLFLLDCLLTDSPVLKTMSANGLMTITRTSSPAVACIHSVCAGGVDSVCLWARPPLNGWSACSPPWQSCWMAGIIAIPTGRRWRLNGRNSRAMIGRCLPLECLRPWGGSQAWAIATGCRRYPVNTSKP